VSLPVAARGEKDYLRGAWLSASFDFELACRTYGRNDAFWVLCYRLLLDGEALPTERELRKLVTTANRATGGLNRQGERERYTRYEAQATVEQVSSYAFSTGLKPMLRARRRWASGSRSRCATPPARRLLGAICDLAAACGRVEEIRASHRQLAERADLHPGEVSSLLYALQDAGQVFRLGFTPCYQGRPRGTTRLSLKPPRPAQNVDELRPPRWDASRATWAWDSSLARGTISQSRLRWLTRRKPSAAADVPYVYASPSRTCASAFQDVSQVSVETLSSRGSP
jgi:hypothetical protein